MIVHHNQIKNDTTHANTIILRLDNERMNLPHEVWTNSVFRGQSKSIIDLCFNRIACSDMLQSWNLNPELHDSYQLLTCTPWNIHPPLTTLHRLPRMEEDRLEHHPPPLPTYLLSTATLRSPKKAPSHRNPPTGHRNYHQPLRPYDQAWVQKQNMVNPQPEDAKDYHEAGSKTLQVSPRLSGCRRGREESRHRIERTNVSSYG